MNVHPGGKQPVMHPGRLPNGQEQQMVDSRGVLKGLQQVLQERGVDTRKMKKKDMVERLQQFDDFKYELNTVQRYLIKDLRHRCISSPKVCIQQICIYFCTFYIYAICYTVSLIQFHPELNLIERCWGMAKRYARANCDYSFKKLRIVPVALDTITLDHIRKHFRKCRDYHCAYMDGKTAVDAVAEVKTYKSHRRVPMATTD